MQEKKYWLDSKGNVTKVYRGVCIDESSGRSTARCTRITASNWCCWRCRTWRPNWMFWSRCARLISPARVAATAQYPDEEAPLREAGANDVFNIYAEAGAGFADHVDASQLV